MKLRLFFILPILLLPLFPMSITAQESSALEYVDCPFAMPEGEIEGETIDCAVVTVPESRTGLSNATVELAVIALYATGEEKVDPILYLAGGPGNSGTAMLEEFLDDPIREVATIILLDQRGTGYSLPSLDCPEEESETTIRNCYNRLVEAGVTLDAYRSAENAADVNELIDILGLTSVNIYGISYGTRLALTVMKNPNPAIRAVILDGVYPPDVHAYEEDATNITRVFDLIVERCAQDAACNGAFPELEAVLYTTVENLDADPLTISGPEGEITVLDAETFVGELFFLLYDTASIPYIPALIYAAANRDAEALALFYYSADLSARTQSLIHKQSPENDGNSEGMFKSVDCADEAPFNDIDVISATIADLDLPESWNETIYEGTVEGLDICAIWLVSPSDASIRQATVSDIPTLIFNGEYDPVTPPAWGVKAAETLPNSYLFTMPAGGHGVIDMAECPLDIAYQFLLDPSTAPDGSCIETMPPPPWFVDYP